MTLKSMEKKKTTTSNKKRSSKTSSFAAMKKCPLQTLSLRRERLTYHKDAPPNQLSTSPASHYPVVALLGNLCSGSPLSILDGTRSFSPFKKTFVESTRITAIALAPSTLAVKEFGATTNMTTAQTTNLQHSEQWISSKERLSLPMPTLIIGTWDGKVEAAALTADALVKKPKAIFSCDDSPITSIITDSDWIVAISDVASKVDHDDHHSLSKVFLYSRTFEEVSASFTINAKVSVATIDCNELFLSCNDELFIYSIQSVIGNEVDNEDNDDDNNHINNAEAPIKATTKISKTKLKNSIKVNHAIIDLVIKESLIILALANETIITFNRHTLIQEEQRSIPLLRGLLRSPTAAWTFSSIHPLVNNGSTVHSKRPIHLLKALKIPINDHVGRRSQNTKQRDWIDCYVCQTSDSRLFLLSVGDGVELELPITTPIMNCHSFAEDSSLLVAQATFDPWIQRNKIGIWDFGSVATVATDSNNNDTISNKTNIKTNKNNKNKARSLRSEVRLCSGTRIVNIAMLGDALLCNVALSNREETETRLYTFTDEGTEVSMSTLPVKNVKTFSCCPVTNMAVLLDAGNVLHFYSFSNRSDGSGDGVADGGRAVKPTSPVIIMVPVRKWDLRLDEGDFVLEVCIRKSRLAILTSKNEIKTWTLKNGNPSNSLSLKEAKTFCLTKQGGEGGEDEGEPSAMIYILSNSNDIISIGKEGGISVIGGTTGTAGAIANYQPPSQGWKAFWQSSWNGPLLSMAEMQEDSSVLLMNQRSLWKFVPQGRCIKIQDDLLYSSLVVPTSSDGSSLFILENPKQQQQQLGQQKRRYGLN